MQVFLSHTAELRRLPKDGSFVAAAENAVKRYRATPVDMGYFTSSPDPPAELCERRVRESDVYVAVVGFRYGSPVRDRPNVSYTELEFDTATAAGIPRLAFLLSEDTEGPRALLHDPERSAEQAAFRRKVLDSGVTATSVTSPAELETVVYQALSEIHPPTSPTSVWNVPARNPDFVGREELLARVHDRLGAGDTTVVQAVHGAGGVGKTALATEYAHRFRADYDLVWWVASEDLTTVPDQLARLARALGVAEDTTPAGLAVDRLRGALAERARWLLVFDNAEDPAGVRSLLPGGPGHVLITSRDPGWRGVAHAIEIDVLPRAEAVAFLQAEVAGLSEVDADAIADRLGDLPLALATAAGYLADTGTSAATYLELLDRNVAAILDRGTPADYPTSLAAGWRLALDRLPDDAVQLLRIAAHLAPEPIPLTLFTDRPEGLPDALAVTAADPLAFTDLTALLRRRGLARIETGTVTLHRLAQAVLRSHGDPAPAVTALRLVRKAAPPDPWNAPSVWPTWQTLFPHALAVTAAGQADEDREEVAWLLDRAATYLQARGEPRTALPLFEAAHRTYRAAVGDEHLGTLASANNLALDLCAAGQHDQARPLARDTLDRRRQVLGDEHPDTRRTEAMLAGWDD